jgi:DNA-directed RNA polymerase subunit N (RpoN/RPB10)
MKYRMIIRCSTCGYFIGRHTISMIEEKNKHCEKSVVTNMPMQIQLKPGAVNPLEKFFDKEKIINRCCRMQLMTQQFK